MSELVEERLIGLLDHPHVDPYGNPIPGLAELGENFAEPRYLEGVAALPTLFETAAKKGMSGPSSATLARIAEPLQTDVELLARLSEAGIVPGARITLALDGNVYTVGAEGSDTVLDLPEDLAKHLFAVV